MIERIFEDEAAANEAKNKLLMAGFADGTVTVSEENGGTTNHAMATGSTRIDKEEEGTISSFFSSIFGSDDDEKTDRYGNAYRGAIRRALYGVSVNVHNDDDIGRAEEILTGCGALDIDEQSEQWRGEGWTAGGYMASETADTLKEISEELKVGKRSVARGGVRVFSQLIETPVEETVRLRQEQVDVQRRAVDRLATEADFAAFKEGGVEVREISEEAVVSKEARVVGEVDVGKTITEHDETVRDTVRETRVEVEKLDDQADLGNVPTLPQDTKHPPCSRFSIDRMPSRNH